MITKNTDNMTVICSALSLLW